MSRRPAENQLLCPFWASVRLRKLGNALLSEPFYYRQCSWPGHEFPLASIPVSELPKD